MDSRFRGNDELVALRNRDKAGSLERHANYRLAKDPPSNGTSARRSRESSDLAASAYSYRHPRGSGDPF
jgi:hypothetical protein